MNEKLPDKNAYEPRRLTWAVLVGRWVEFAQSAIALPDHAEGHAMKESVADVITLQAIFMALQELDQLRFEEQALGLDKAGLMCRESCERILNRYHEIELPDLLAELMKDCRDKISEERERFTQLREEQQKRKEDH